MEKLKLRKHIALKNLVCEFFSDRLSRIIDKNPDENPDKYNFTVVQKLILHCSPKNSQLSYATVSRVSSEQFVTILRNAYDPRFLHGIQPGVLFSVAINIDLNPTFSRNVRQQRAC